MWRRLCARFRSSPEIDLLLLNFSQGAKIMSIVTDIQAQFDAFVPVATKAFADGAQAFTDVSAKLDDLVAQIIDLKNKLDQGGIVTAAELSALQTDLNSGIASLSTAAASQEAAAAAIEAKIAPAPEPVPAPQPEPTPVDNPPAQ